ncbi:spore germination protein [Ferroacidibacillus organovorans]|uniref:Spore gernimation protein GerA n=2 Tax=Ferroacidibacillus organovorans TaxID=1765683 RepID=A0A853KDR8_9BACL|nr:spore germination protein [Ferroacidibacillus organovorans]KYP82019.1 spore gernimation protein GerA [Ferroacidibacillus organovorans]OAG94339.1 spore gernimation protein GerA [Ferroacidibacillus organovorans]
MDWSRFTRLLTVDDSVMDEAFVLTPEDQRKTSGKRRNHRRDVPYSRLRLLRAKVNIRESQQSANYESDVEISDKREDRALTSRDVYTSERTFQTAVRPISFEELATRAIRRTTGETLSFQGPIPKAIQYDLATNRRILTRLFRLPRNADIVIRDFSIGGDHPFRAIAVFVDGLADKTIINTHILEPLMYLTNLDHQTPRGQWLDHIKQALVPGNQAVAFKTWKEASENILAGSTVLFFDGISAVLSVETKGWEHRTVGLSQSEAVVRGPHDAFTESFRANTGLVRAKLRSPRLVTEMLQIGTLASTDVAIMYMDGVTNPKLVTEIKKRIMGIEIDYLPDSGMLEQFLEDGPISFFPKFLSTERPDRVAYGLSEGQVAIFVGHSTFALLAPVLFWTLLQTSEDAYLRWPFGSFIRVIRLISLTIALLLPSFYIAVTNFHPEMIPTDLMLAIAASRERVPFPVVLEVVLMEFSIELIREAGIRIPTIIGPTIGIVGALILGQAAVAAGIISPLLIIVVAVTALASFTMPNYNLSFSVRLLRFGFIVAGAAFGFYGIALGLMILLMHMVTVRSLGVPIMSPIAPRRTSSPDSLLRGKIFKMEQRPNAYWPLRTRKEAEVTRGFDPRVADSEEAKRARRGWGRRGRVKK